MWPKVPPIRAECPKLARPMQGRSFAIDFLSDHRSAKRAYVIVGQVNLNASRDHVDPSRAYENKSSVNIKAWADRINQKKSHLNESAVHINSRSVDMNFGPVDMHCLIFDIKTIVMPGP
jgi:hypothetical protein